MEKEIFKNLIKPKLVDQTIYQLTQVKGFVDMSLREVATKNFESDEAKIKYLLDTLYNVRDFVLAQTTDNSMRQTLIKQFETIEKEVEAGNEEEHLLPSQEEKSGQSQVENKEE